MNLSCSCRPTGFIEQLYYKLTPPKRMLPKQSLLRIESGTSYKLLLSAGNMRSSISQA